MYSLLEHTAFWVLKFKVGDINFEEVEHREGSPDENTPIIVQYELDKDPYASARLIAVINSFLNSTDLKILYENLLTITKPLLKYLFSIHCK